MTERAATGRAGIPVVLWLAGAAFAAVVALMVAISLAGVSGTVIAGVGAAAVTGAVSIVLAVIGLQDRLWGARSLPGL
jgi:hypothetical protein